MTVDTSRPAVEALITDLRNPAWNVDQSRTASALQVLLDERDAQNGALRTLEHTVQECQQDIGKRDERIRDLENTLIIVRASRAGALVLQERAEAERDRLSRGLDEAEAAIQAEVERTQKVRGERDKLAAKLDAVKAAVERDAEDRLGERMQSTPVVAKATIRAILADTDEGSER